MRAYMDPAGKRQGVAAESGPKSSIDLPNVSVSQSVISRSHPALTPPPALNPAPPLTFHVPFNLLPPPPHKQWAKAQIPQAMSNPPIKRPATYQYALPVRREAHTLATSGAAPSRRPASRRMHARGSGLSGTGSRSNSYVCPLAPQRGGVRSPMSSQVATTIQKGVTKHKQSNLAREIE